MFFDSHAHYDDLRYDADRTELLNSFKQNGIDYVVNIGTNLETAQKCLELSEKYDLSRCILSNPVTTSPYRINAGSTYAQLLALMSIVHIHCPAFSIKCISPDMIQKLISCVDNSTVFQQQTEQFNLL